MIEKRQMDSRTWKLRLIDSGVISIQNIFPSQGGGKGQLRLPEQYNSVKGKCPETNFIQNQLCTRPTGLPSPAGRTWRNYITQIVVHQLIKWTSIESSKFLWLLQNSQYLVLKGIVVQSLFNLLHVGHCFINI